MLRSICNSKFGVMIGGSWLSLTFIQTPTVNPNPTEAPTRVDQTNPTSQAELVEGLVHGHTLATEHGDAHHSVQTVNC